MKKIISGLESSGKSLRLAKEIKRITLRNSEWFKVTGIKRPIVSNLKIAPHFENFARSINVPIIYWDKLEQLLQYNDADIIIDEVGNYFDARKWQDLSADIKKWLTQGAKSGIEIYGTSQDFAQVDKAFRRLTNVLEHVTKVIGSPRPSPTKPPVKKIWGLCMVHNLNPRAYKEDKEKFDSSGLPSFFFIEKEFCLMYDTRQKIEVAPPPPYRHEVRTCNDCDYSRIIHS